MGWRLADSLKKLREQVNAAYPNRDKSSDGSIGDAAHASRNSDHNPWVFDRGQGVVTAIDIDEDVDSSGTLMPIVKAICASRDPRVKYIIYEGKITVSSTKLQQWKSYTGKNAHRHHAHISVFPARDLYDDRRDWNIGVLNEPVVLEIPDADKSVRVPSDHAAVVLPETAVVSDERRETGDESKGTFVAENKSVDAPPAEGSTATATKVTVAGFVVPTFLAATVTAIKSAFADGFVSPAQVGEVAINFIAANTKYVFAGIGLIIAGMMLKKLYKQITLWLQMYFAARSDMHNVTVKPQ